MGIGLLMKDFHFAQLQNKTQKLITVDLAGGVSQWGGPG